MRVGMRQVCCAIINSKFGEMWAGNLNLYILRSNGMEWRFSLYFSLLTSERSRDKPGRRSPEGVGGGGWRGRRRRVGGGRQEEGGLQAFIKIQDFIHLCI